MNLINKPNYLVRKYHPHPFPPPSEGEGEGGGDSAQRGFTLIEIIFFIVLGGFFMAGIMTPFLTSISRSDRPDIVASATFLAAEGMEQLQQMDYLDIASDVAPITLTGNYTAFSRQVTVTLVDASLAVSVDDLGYKLIVVTVFHNKLPAAGIRVISLITDYAG